MLKGFVNVFMKELKELIRDPKILLGMIIVPLVMFPVLGGIMGFSIQSAQEQAEKAAVLVVNNDGGYWSEVFIQVLNYSVKVSEISNITDPAEVVGLLPEHNATQFIMIPNGFSVNVTEHLGGNSSVTASVKFYGIFAGGGMFEGVGSSIVDSLVHGFNRVMAPDVVLVEKSVVIKDAIVEGVDPGLVAGLMISQSIAIPITIMILLTYSMQIAATSVAMEKEEKTLETLLSLPLDRFAILMGKLSGSIFVAGVGALAYMLGYNYMIGSFMGAVPAEVGLDLAALGLVPTAFGYLLLGISLFVTLLSALALAVIMSAFAEDVRGAQSLVSYIYPFLFIPALVLMYVDINALPFALQVFLYAIPFSQPVIASKAVVVGDYLTPLLGIVYVTAFTLVVMYAASRLFATEKVLTAKLRFKGFRKGKKAEVVERD